MKKHGSVSPELRDLLNDQNFQGNKINQFKRFFFHSQQDFREGQNMLIASKLSLHLGLFAFLVFFFFPLSVIKACTSQRSTNKAVVLMAAQTHTGVPLPRAAVQYNP